MYGMYGKNGDRPLPKIPYISVMPYTYGLNALPVRQGIQSVKD